MAREKYLRTLGKIVGDPLVTASKKEESINTFKDMYSIFKVKPQKGRFTSKSPGRRSKSPK